MSDLDVELAAIRAGDADAFGRWLAGAEHRVRASLSSFATVVDTEAVVQESFLRVWQVAPQFTPDGRPDALLRFCIRIARNLAIDEVRRDKRRTQTHESAEDERATIDVPNWEPDPLLREIIRVCREKLPGKPGQVFALRLDDAGRRPDRELAAYLQMTMDAFLQNVSRARKLLRACLAKSGVDLDSDLPGGAT